MLRPIFFTQCIEQQNLELIDTLKCQGDLNFLIALDVLIQQVTKPSAMTIQSKKVRLDCPGSFGHILCQPAVRPVARL